MKTLMREMEMESISANFRMVYIKDEIEELAVQLDQEGQKDPIIVWYDGVSFRILDGEKRWRAGKKLGWKKITAVIEHGALKPVTKL